MRNGTAPASAGYGAIRAASTLAADPPRASTPGYGSVPPVAAFSAAPAAAFSAAPASGYVKIATIASPDPAAVRVATPSMLRSTPEGYAPATEAPTATPAARVANLFTRFREQGQALIAAGRPWQEVFHAAAFSAPANTGEATTRIRRNLAYFRANYTIAALLVLVLSFLWHPGSMISIIGLIAAWYYLYFSRTAPLVLFGRTFDDGSVLAALTGVTIIALLFTNVGWNLIGAMFVAVALVGVHATFRSTDDLFLNEQEAAVGGLVSAVGAPALQPYVRMV